MKRYELTITLIEDCIFSERAASEGGHKSLDYIPGITLLGACASKIYTNPSIDSYDIFHSGKVRFGNAYPLSIEGYKTLPMPFVWHSEKGKETTRKVGKRFQLQPDQIFNLAKTKIKEAQPKQLREGYVSNALEQLKPSKSLRMKTAINPETATAAESQLFGYQALEAGQAFKATIDIDGGIGEEQSQKILDVFSQTLYLGRSRTAQYGQVKCEVREVTLENGNTSIKADSEVSIWFTSDTALLDSNGLPVTAKNMTKTDLDDATVLWDKSFLRYRRYSPYNTKRGKFDLERQVIEKGSVLTVKLKKDIKPDKFQTGIGAYREAGLGQVVIQHPLLKGEHPEEIEPLGESINSSPEKPNNPLANFLSNAKQNAKASREDREYADKKAAELEQLYKLAYAYAAVDQKNDLGPTASQWSRVAEVGKQYQLKQDKEKLLFKLFGDASSDEQKNKDIICKRADEAWGVNCSNEKVLTFGTWLKAALSDKSIHQPGTVATLIARVASNELKRRSSMQLSKQASKEENV